MRSIQALALGLLGLCAYPFGGVVASDNRFETHHFSGSGNCADCHNGLSDRDGHDVSIESEWAATMMAHSARNPLWQAKYAAEIYRSPGLEHEINGTCTRCHAPMAHVEASANNDAIELFGDGFSDPANPYHDAAMEGVGCTLCHQIAASPTLGTPEGASGGFEIRDQANPSDRPAYGPYAQPRVNPMRRESGFTPRVSSHISESALCATCHNLVTPVLDSNGELMPGVGFHEQAVYTEWEHSAFADGAAEAESCQACHMARADGVRIANRPRNLPARNGFARHGFYGGNTLMLDILNANREALDVGQVDFEAAIEATRATLRSAAEVSIEDAQVSGDALLVRVRVTNNTGHKLPTSYPSRRAYLQLRVTDETGAVVFESGRTNPDGSIVGVDSDFGGNYEPHYSGEITRPDQVQVYEPVLADLDGQQTHTLLRAADYLKDNRIPPRGFDKWAVPEAVAVTGEALADPDFGDGSDLVTYRIDLAGANGAVAVSAELRYQTLSFGFLRDLEQDRHLPEVARFLSMYEASQIRAETIANATAKVAGPGAPIQPSPPVQPGGVDPSPTPGPGKPDRGRRGRG